MTGTALAMVLASACLHASWNFLAKKSLNKIAFIWWLNLAALVIYCPMFLYFWPKTNITAEGWGYVTVTGVLHFFYYVALGKAYQYGDLSLVYPISRGFGPLLVPILAAMIIKEKIPPLGYASIGLVIVGQYVIHLRSFALGGILDPFRSANPRAYFWAVCTGITIASYSLVDKIGVGLVQPPVYIYLMFIVAIIPLTALVRVTGRQTLFLEWRTNWPAILAAGAAMIGTYLIVLYAFQIAKVGYVVTVRETSIVFSVIFGVYRLKEKYAPQRLLGAGLIGTGVIGIGLAG